ncbi:hypothetical protein QJS66_05595 [Kocuria rhizophila]|nr:hypothetical protein QJS66_05595 [Kocuria rhizophila]
MRDAPRSSRPSDAPWSWMEAGKVLALAGGAGGGAERAGQAERAEDLSARAVAQAVEPGSAEGRHRSRAPWTGGSLAPETEITVPPSAVGSEKIRADTFRPRRAEPPPRASLRTPVNTEVVMRWRCQDGQGTATTTSRNRRSLSATGIELPASPPGILTRPHSGMPARITRAVGRDVPDQAAHGLDLPGGGQRREAGSSRGRGVHHGPGRHGHHAESPPEQVISETAAQADLDVMEPVGSPRRRKDAAVPGYRVGGKTSTREAPARGRLRRLTTSFVGDGAVEPALPRRALRVPAAAGNVHTVGVTSTFFPIMSQVLPRSTWRPPPPRRRSWTCRCRRT